MSTLGFQKRKFTNFNKCSSVPSFVIHNFYFLFWFDGNLFGLKMKSVKVTLFVVYFPWNKYKRNCIISISGRQFWKLFIWTEKLWLKWILSEKLDLNFYGFSIYKTEKFTYFCCIFYNIYCFLSSFLANPWITLIRKKERQKWLLIMKFISQLLFYVFYKWINCSQDYVLKAFINQTTKNNLKNKNKLLDLKRQVENACKRNTQPDLV